MRAQTLLDRLTRRGVRIQAWGDRLHVGAPCGTLDAVTRELICTHKVALLEVLIPPMVEDYRSPGTPPWRVRCRDWRSGKIRTAETETLADALAEVKRIGTQLSLALHSQFEVHQRSPQA